MNNEQIIKSVAVYNGWTLEQAQFRLVPSVFPKVEEPEDKRSNPLFDVIYSVDEETGFPKGDYVTYLSKSASNELRDFIQKNLLNELPAEDGVDLDKESDLFRYHREKGETSSDYAARVSRLAREDAQKIFAREKKTKTEDK